MGEHCFVITIRKESRKWSIKKSCRASKVYKITHLHTYLKTSIVFNLYIWRTKLVMQSPPFFCVIFFTVQLNQKSRLPCFVFYDTWNAWFVCVGAWLDHIPFAFIREHLCNPFACHIVSNPLVEILWMYCYIVSSIYCYYWKWNFPMTPHVLICRLVGWLVGWWVGRSVALSEHLFFNKSKK